jgi:hypothetical protein
LGDCRNEKFFITIKVGQFISDRGELPYSFLELMMDLSYSGHFHLAMTLAEELWPVE